MRLPPSNQGVEAVFIVKYYGMKKILKQCAAALIDVSLWACIIAVTVLYTYIFPDATKLLWAISLLILGRLLMEVF